MSCFTLTLWVGHYCQSAAVKMVAGKGEHKYLFAAKNGNGLFPSASSRSVMRGVCISLIFETIQLQIPVMILIKR